MIDHDARDDMEHRGREARPSRLFVRPLRGVFGMLVGLLAVVAEFSPWCLECPG